MQRLLIAAATSLALVTCAPAFAGNKPSKGTKADYRSAKTGKYVKKSHADKNKDTTVKEARKP